ncbi:MAG TPA: hypothetical protein VLD57_11360 [Blastocatellia bacterium]|nr:hypothetical protein [Blastocatellia bacterium]
MVIKQSSIVFTFCLLLLCGAASHAQSDRARAEKPTDTRVGQAWKFEAVATTPAASKPQPAEVERPLTVASTHVEPLLLLLLGSSLLAIATGIKLLLSRKPLNVDR